MSLNILDFSLFSYKLFCYWIFQILVYFLWRNCKLPLKKSHPLSPSNSPPPSTLRSWQTLPFWKFATRLNPPPPLVERGGGAHYVYDVIHRLNKNLKTYCLISAEGKEGKMKKKLHQKLILDYILVLVNSPKQPMNAKLLKQNDQKTLRRLSFALCSFMDKNMKRKRDLELLTSLSLGCLTCLEKFLF